MILPEICDIPNCEHLGRHTGHDAEAGGTHVHCHRARLDAASRGQAHQQAGPARARARRQCARRPGPPRQQGLGRAQGQHGSAPAPAQQGQRVGLLVQGEAGLAAEVVAQGQRGFGQTALGVVFGIAIQLQVDAIWK